MLSLLNLSLLLIAQTISVWDIPASNKVQSLVESTETCITRYRHGAQRLRVPTSIRTIRHAVTKTMLEAPAQRTITLTITATSYGPESTAAAEEQDTSTIWIAETPSEPATCSFTTQITPSATTIYTGTYNAPTSSPQAPTSQSKRTHSRFELNTNLLMHFAGHSPFQNHLKLPRRVNCIAHVTTYHLTASTCAAKAITTTLTISPSPFPFPTIHTQTITKTFPPSPLSPCTLTLPTPTTTLHQKCSPQNLISSFPSSNYTKIGIAATRPGPYIIEEGLFPGGDPSACCQLCMDGSGADDQEICAGMADDVQAGNCFLFYVAAAGEKGEGDGCGLAFDYIGSETLGEGEGFVVQGGCGTLNAVDSMG